MRVATIDIGTNAVLLLVAERDASGELAAVEEREELTRLGEGVDRTRALSPAAIARTCACLDRYAARIRDLRVEKVAVVGTSAMRDASGGDAVRAHVRASLGIEARVLTGEEEARLGFAGAVSGLMVENGHVLVFDVGGGSTEVVLGTVLRDGPRVTFAKSFDVGSVRLTERHVRHDPPATIELAELRAVADEAFRDLPDMPFAGQPIGVAGTITTLAAIVRNVDHIGEKLHGAELDVAEMETIVARLAGMSLAERRAVRGLAKERADVIVAGGTIALALLRRVKARRCRVSHRGVRWGLAGELEMGVS